jgi:hypothetical protein
MHPDQAADIALGLTRLCVEHNIWDSPSGGRIPDDVRDMFLVHFRALVDEAESPMTAHDAWVLGEGALSRPGQGEAPTESILRKMELLQAFARAVGDEFIHTTADINEVGDDLGFTQEQVRMAATALEVDGFIKMNANGDTTFLTPEGAREVEKMENLNESHGL